MSGKLEAERLISSVKPLAEEMLREHGEFYPYGGYLQFDGSVVHVGVKDPKTDHPKSVESIESLWSYFEELAHDGLCTVFALVFDVRVRPPGFDLKTDAIQICVEHIDGYSAEVFYPYTVVNNELAYAPTFAHDATRRIFQ